MVSSAGADPGPANYDLDELPSLDFDELMATDVQVTSAMKRLQNMSETAASIYVLTNKEIIQSGVTSVAQALTLVPGMQVRRLDKNQWAITSRSVAGRYSSKLLVMVDGQSIYNPGFAGVYWEALNIPLYDIDRIEVIRGQGGLLWGSNATNGVVNIISKHTADTRSTLAQAEAGSQINHKLNFRVGGDLANYSSFRIFGAFEDTEASSESSKSLSPGDDGKKKSIGGRVDLNLNDNISLLAQTQYTHIEMGQNLKLANLSTYQNEYIGDQYTRDHLQVMTRLEHRISSVSNQMLQASISSQKGQQLYYKDDFLIADIDYQMNTLINNIQFDWGVNYRYTAISVNDTDYITNIDDIDSYQHFGGFLQGQFNLMPEKLKLILGNRSERNSFTGWEHQPMARLLWTPYSSHTFWGAISQGVRIPSLIEYNGTALGTSAYGIKAEINGSADIEAEKSISEELGYRYTANSWGLDLSLFHTKARNVLVVDKSVNATYTLISIDFVSDAELTTYGGEAVLKWQPYQQLTTELGYSFSSYKYDLPSGTSAAIGDDSYLRQIMAKMHFSITANHSLSAIYRIENGGAYETDDYSILDLSWNWKITPAATFTLTGNNLLYGKHLEYNNSSETYTVSTYTEPSYLVRITAEF
ncbi:TonB-dependent receptor plug domain-containing protein [Psychromonas sp.]|uniref:TonB-dependent receptor plug domain-containing protein n=1 Tax=Psychromonas sp. TaxID=1884585 RepID=UPI0039E6B1AE